MSMKIREERLKRGWSITRLTQLTGIASSDLSQIERGLQFVHPGWRRRISRAFGMSASELFSRDYGNQNS
jgi:transcriptional regulator with XRE-family HTH domain